MSTKQIVIAWAEKTKLVPTGRYVTRDMNLFPEFKAEWEGRAAMWLRKGKDADLAKAHKHAETDGRLVFVFPADEPEPLQKAREMAVAAVSKSVAA